MLNGLSYLFCKTDNKGKHYLQDVLTLSGRRDLGVLLLNLGHQKLLL